MESEAENKPIKMQPVYKKVVGLIATFLAAGCLLILVGTSHKRVTIIDGGCSIEAVAYGGTVGEILNKNKIQINYKDKLMPEIDKNIEDNMVITIRRAVPVKVIFDGEDTEFLSAEETVGEALASESIKYSNIDKVYPDLDMDVSEDMTIRIVRVTEKEITEKHAIPFANELQQMPDWEKGVQKLVGEGAKGEELETIKIVYEDGVEKERETVGCKILKPPVSRLTALGTLDSKINSRGEPIRFEKVLTMKATSYTNDVACTGKDGGNTATGAVPRRKSDGGKWSTVAVDPKVIPLGTKLWIEGYGYGIAEDVGGAVKGNIIDLFFTAGTEEYRQWHTHKTKVYILK